MPLSIYDFCIHVKIPIVEQFSLSCKGHKGHCLFCPPHVEPRINSKDSALIVYTNNLRTNRACNYYQLD